MERIMAHHEAEIHGYPAPIIGGIAVPLAVKADDDIAAVPQSRAEVNRFSIDAARMPDWTRWQGIAAKPKGRGLGPVFEVVGNMGDQRPNPAVGSPVQSALPIHVIGAVPFDAALWL